MYYWALNLWASSTTVEALEARPLVVGLNGALQRRIGLKSLVVGSVNRALSSSVGPGGKGQGAWLASGQLAQRRDTKYNGTWLLYPRRSNSP